MNRAVLAALLLPLAACGGRSGFHRPDYAAEAEMRCDQAESASDSNRALSLFGMALEADPKMARAHYGRALLLDERGRRDEAERSYKWAVEYGADDVKARYLLGRAKYFLKWARMEAAVRDLNQAISLLSTWPMDDVAAEARLLRADCRVKLRAWEAAVEDLDAADKAGLDSGQAERAKVMRMRVDAAKAEDRR